MLTLQDFKDLKEDLLNNKKSLDEIANILRNNIDKNKRSWHTKDWKERRKSIIKDYCEICNSRENLTLQHQSHPQNFYQQKNAEINSHRHEWEKIDINKDDFYEYVINNFDYKPEPICPNCGIWSPRERKKLEPKFVCTNANCKHEFNNPTFKSIKEIVVQHLNNNNSTFLDKKCFTSKDKYANLYDINGIDYSYKKQQVVKSKAPEIDRKATLKFIDDNIKYLSFEYTITACRRCAYHWDIKKMDLCPKCNHYYKSFQYETCINCLPEERRRIILEQNNFNNEMYKMHKDLGID